MAIRNCNPATWRGSDERGIFVPLLAVLAVMLLAFSGLVLDGGRIYFEQRRMQIAADAGALGGAHDLWRAQDSFVESAALADARVNHYDDGAADVAVTVNHPPLSGARASDADFVEVEIERTVPLGFMRIVGQTLGDGATFFLTSTEGVISGKAKDFGSIDIAGNSTVQLKAPTVSTYGGIPGILFFVDRRAPNHNHKIVGNTLSMFTGGIYVPTGNLAVRGQADALGSWQYVVADTVEFKGTSETNNNYAGGAGSPNLPMLRAATLVE